MTTEIPYPLPGFSLVTVPSAVAYTGVPLGAVMSTPVCTRRVFKIGWYRFPKPEVISCMFFSGRIAGMEVNISDFLVAILSSVSSDFDCTARRTVSWSAFLFALRNILYASDCDIPSKRVSSTSRG